MSHVLDRIELTLPVDEVYRFVTTPATWPRWHPSSLGVSEAIDHSLGVGERVSEEFLVAGRRGLVVWTVVERSAPTSWTIAGKVIGGGEGVITYRCTPSENGTLFEREFRYRMPNLKLTMLDLLLFRRRVRRESAQAVRQLRKALVSATAERVAARV